MTITRSMYLRLFHLLLLCILTSPALACGPWLPRLLLGDDPQDAHRSPVADLVTELLRLPALPKLPVGVQPQRFDTEEYQQVRDGGLILNKNEERDVTAALAYYHVPYALRPQIVTAYGDVRHLIQENSDAQLIRRELDVEMETIFRDTPLPPELPSELGEYLRGAMAFRSGDIDETRTIWMHLLARPASERRFRSTWAAYMLGRMAAWDAPTDEAQRAEAIRWLQRVRSLVQEGCADGLNLVGLSYYWEAQLQPEDDPDKATQLYALSLAAGCSWAALPLEDVGKEILETEDDSVRAHAARVPLLRQLTTAFALADCSRRLQWHNPDSDKENTEVLKGWLSALEGAGVEDVEEADRLAWLAYDNGEFAAAAAWLKRAPVNAPMAVWLRGKLALRDGDSEAAAAQFAHAARLLPKPPAEIYPDHAWWDASPAPSSLIAQTRQLQGDLGISELNRGHFARALESLLRSGAWLDAAYVAERVMTPDDLLRFLQQHPALLLTAPARLRDPNDPEAFALLRDDVPQALRYLLARRLARANRLAEARGFMPVPLLFRFDEYCEGIRRGHDPLLPETERSAALWQAARIHRYLGMELFGTETAPDWSFYDGQFEEIDIGAFRAGKRVVVPLGRIPPENPRNPLATGKEIRRNGQSRPLPDTRFHYRYVAADLAWEATQLAPPDEETARMLCVAGGWLKSRDAQAADRFYQELVGRCGQTGLGVTGEIRRWFPPVHDEPIVGP